MNCDKAIIMNIYMLWQLCALETSVLEKIGMTPPLVKSFPFGFFILTLYQKNVTSALYCYTVISTNNMVLVSKYEFKIWKKYT